MIFMYHGVLGEGAPEARWCIGQALPLSSVRRQLEWLARRFRLVPITEYLHVPTSKRGRRLGAITFDDGAKETFDNVVPILRREGVPATLFVSTGHLCGGPLLWFSHLDALCFEKIYVEVTVEGRRFPLTTLHERKLARHNLGAMARKSRRPADFAAALGAAYPLPPETHELYGGMSEEQLAKAGTDDLLEIGSHTVSHPYLSGISETEQIREISESKRILSALSGRPVRYFAYPGGDYDVDVAARVRGSGYEAAFATRPRSVAPELFEIGRVGIYSPSMLKLKLKAAGLVELAESVGMRVG
jgi:peptidoglycan/xylan/chitin deacetylase (PgdA/CDA1 family)